MPTYLSPGVYVEEVAGGIPPDRGRRHLGRGFRRPGGEGPGQRTEARVQLDPVHRGVRRLRRELLPRPCGLRLVPQRRRQLLRRAHRCRAAATASAAEGARGRQAGHASAATRCSPSRRARPRARTSRSASRPRAARARRTTSSSWSCSSTGRPRRPTTTSPPSPATTTSRPKVNAASKLINLEETSPGSALTPMSQGPGRPGRARAGADAARDRRTSAPATTSATRRERTGFGGLEAVEEVTMVAVPDLVAALEQGAIDLETFKAVQLAMIAHCELMGDRIAILDPPPSMNAQEVPNGGADEAGYDSKFASALLAVDQGLRPGLGHQQVRAAVRTHGRRLGAQRRHPRRAQGAGQRGRPRCDLAADADHQGRARPAQPDRHQLHPHASPAVGSASGARGRCPATRRGGTSTCGGSSTTSRSPSSSGTQWVVFEPNDHAAVGPDQPHDQRLPHQRVAQGRALRPHAGRGVLRQVRRRDQPGRGHRRRPGGLPDRRRPGEARRVRHLPAVAVLRRHQPRHPNDDPATSRSRHGTRRCTRHQCGQRASSSRSTASEIPKVNEVSGLKTEVDKIELKQQTSDGKYVVTPADRPRQGRRVHGHAWPHRLARPSPTGSRPSSQGDVAGARKTASVAAARLRRLADQDATTSSTAGCRSSRSTRSRPARPSRRPRSSRSATTKSTVA